MMEPTTSPRIRVFRTFSREARQLRRDPNERVGQLFEDKGVGVLWVSKRTGQRDRHWFQHPEIGVLVILRGRLLVEFREKKHRPQTLGPGDVLVVPPNTDFRANSTPHGASEPTLFLTVYRTARPD
jgi:mannose-6-phosphate isomerase-like protein (cupin superfamily)